MQREQKWETGPDGQVVKCGKNITAVTYSNAGRVSGWTFDDSFVGCTEKKQ